MKQLIACALALTIGQTTAIGQQPHPLTRPERTNFEETSRYEDVTTFLAELSKASPAVRLTTFGKTVEGRDLPLAVIGAPAATAEAVRRTGKLRVYIQANIHAGEVEGKESAQMLLRDLAQGKHADWLKSMVVLVAPIYNADGSERFSFTSRGRQHGPIGGQGQRANAQGLDLNRDHMKLDSPEARAVVRLMNEYDPHVSIDLHTTNGTEHGYDLTYAPPLNPATDRTIIDRLRGDWLPSVARALEAKYAGHYYYYGNVQETAAGDRRWVSFDHRPRFNNNYIGLRNRIAILSEAYAYLQFWERIQATSRFLDELLAYAHRQAGALRQLIERVDRRKVVGHRLAVRAEVDRSADAVEIRLRGTVPNKHPKDGHIMLLRGCIVWRQRMPEYGTFRATETERVPAAYFVPPSLVDAVDRLRAHGIKMTEIRGAMKAKVEEFVIESSETSSQPFQNHRERTLKGAWMAAEIPRTIAAGTLRVDMTQPLARLAFYLIEPRSDDGLVNWNLLDDALKDAKVYPILRTRN